MTLGNGLTALVTGGTGGIGAQLVRRLCADGVEVVAGSIEREKLDALAGETGCEAIYLDVTDRQGLLDALAGREIDIVVACAGALGLSGKTYELAGDAGRSVAEVNILGLQNTLEATVPGMVARNRGHVVTIGSVAGLYPSLGQPVYSATKAAVHNMTLNLRMELYGTDIRVSEVRPGRVASGMHREMFGGDEARAAELLYDPYECLSCDDVAGCIHWILSAPPHVDVTQIEIMPTHHVIGGVRFHSRSAQG